jgi:DNA-binding PadR family transcriptional regulator
MPKKAMDILTESMFYVLMAFCQRPMCGIDAAAFIEERTHGRLQIGPATLYTILGKFEKEKYIREIQVDGRKRTYQITDKGRHAYEEEVQRLRQCVADAEGGFPYGKT